MAVDNLTSAGLDAFTVYLLLSIANGFQKLRAAIHHSSLHPGACFNNEMTFINFFHNSYGAA